MRRWNVLCNAFDRLIMATALEEKLLLITCDSNIRKYDIELFW